MFKKFYLKKHIGASLISSLIFMLIAATVIGELFMLISWSHFSTIDSASNAKILRELDYKIEQGKNYLVTNPAPVTIVKTSPRLSFDMERHEVVNNVTGLYIYDLDYTLTPSDISSLNSDAIINTNDFTTAQKRQYQIEKFIAPMPSGYCLLRAAYSGDNPESADHRVIVESIVKKDSSSKITEIMRQEIWY